METADGQWEEFTVMGIGKAPNLGGDSASFYFPQELLPMMKENVSNFNILAVAVAAITRHSGQSYRKLKTIKRIA